MSLYRIEVTEITKVTLELNCDSVQDIDIDTLNLYGHSVREVSRDDGYCVIGDVFKVNKGEGVANDCD